jgi:hypothetical protein
MKARRITRGRPKAIAGFRRHHVPLEPGLHVARVVSVDGDGVIKAELAAHPGSAVAVRLGLELDTPALATLVQSRRTVLLMVPSDGDKTPWLVALEHSAKRADSGAAIRATALVDGQRVELRGDDEVVLSCGEASITLRRSGRVVVRGTYVETRSKGVNRIKGGSVQIN